MATRRGWFRNSSAGRPSRRITRADADRMTVNPRLAEWTVWSYAPTAPSIGRTKVLSTSQVLTTESIPSRRRMVNCFKKLLGLCLCLAALAVPASVSAQGTTGSISGTVIDESKAVMPGVTITARNVETGLERTQVTDGEGRYRVLNLTPGTYSVTAELQGFSTVRRENLVVAINKDVLADIELKIGGLTEQVNVAGETSSVSLGSTTV